MRVVSGPATKTDRFGLCGLVLMMFASMRPAAGQVQLTRSDANTAVLYSSCNVVVGWNGGRLLGWESNRTATPIICTDTWNGHRDSFAFSIPSAGMISFAWIAGANDGTLAVVGTAYMDDGKAATFVARVSADRRSQTITRVWPYCPRKVVVAPDGVIWTVGWVKDVEKDSIAANNVIRRYDSSGSELATATVHLVGRGLGDDSVSLSHLGSSDDRVAWLTNQNEYLEFALDGKEILRMNGPRNGDDVVAGASAMALGSDNAVLVAVQRKNLLIVTRLDRETRRWMPVSTKGAGLPPWARLMGIDRGQILVSEQAKSLRAYELNLTTK